MRCSSRAIFVGCRTTLTVGALKLDGKTGGERSELDKNP
jgi:hypothetical protein